ncbi:MAG: sterol desaturase family protein [Candidatus Kapaibacteriota bacterium]
MSEKKKMFVSTSPESVKIFNNQLFEYFSKNSWYIPVVTYIPIISYFSFLAFSNNISVTYYILSIILGLFVWSFVEYFLHRFVFHYQPKSEIGKKIHWTFHGVHHDFPQDAKRLVMPPGVSLPLATLFFLFFRLFIPTPFLYSFFGFFLLGYLVYDISHYAFHHFGIKNKFFLKLKSHHMKHHYKDDEQGFGVSSDFWDLIFKTKKM